MQFSCNLFSLSLEEYFVYWHIADTTTSFTVQLLLLGYAVLSVLQALPQAVCLTVSCSKAAADFSVRGIQREKETDKQL